MLLGNGLWGSVTGKLLDDKYCDALRKNGGRLCSLFLLTFKVTLVFYVLSRGNFLSRGSFGLILNH